GLRVLLGSRKTQGRLRMIGERAHALDDVVEAGRLLERRGGLELLEAIGVGAGEDDDGNAGERGVFALRLAELEAVHDRHPQVEDDDARRASALEIRQRLL